MIKKYRIGSPIKTDAVVEEIKIEAGMPTDFHLDENGIFICLADEDIVYGLGENVRGLNKRGHIYTSSCSDEPHHQEGKSSLYAAHNFILISGEKHMGIFVDTPAVVNFDIGYNKYDELRIKFEDNDYDLYIIEAPTDYEIVKEFRAIIGKSYMPPKWALGYGQSRWGYKTKEDILEVVRGHRENGIPLDMVYLDIDYMKDFKNFTIDEEKFPDFEDFVKEMRAENIRLIPIIDAGCKVEEGYDVYEEGVEKGYFCKKEDGQYYTAGVWPGEVHFPDFLNKDARKWFGNKYKFLIDKGIEGFWNDMNEPAMFYEKDRLAGIFDEVLEYKGENIDIYKFFELTNLVPNLFNNKDDYKKFYHEMDGKRYRHDKVHNVFGYNMTRAAGEAFHELTDKEILMFSRSSYIGAHRYGGIWQGDNHSWWSHLEMNIKMTMSLNMVGFLFTGADLGGFGDNTTEDLLLRWLEFGIFTPLMRNHSALDTREQEVYRFSKMPQLKKIIELRYCFIPYIYSSLKKAVENNEMYMRPLAFDFTDDEMAKNVEDQVLLGDVLMLAPIYKQNARGRYVYLPESMKMLKFKSAEDITETVYEAGHHYIDVALDEVVVFIRKGKSLELAGKAEYVEGIDERAMREYNY